MNRILLYIIKPLVKNIYYRTIKRKLKTSHLNYTFSDEKLKFVHLLEVVNYTRVADIPTVYFEFGCHSGRTFSTVINAAHYLKIKNTEFYAFDSFKGLPSTDKKEDGIFKLGAFNTSKKDFISIIKNSTGLEIKSKNMIEGFYESSLTPELQSKLPKVGIVHIDVDLYSSTVTVLNFIKPLLMNGSVILFDDWYCFPPSENKGEKRAFNEFCQKNPEFKFEEWKTYSTFGKSFFVKSIATT